MHPDTKPLTPSNTTSSRWAQIGWFVAIWIASVLSLSIVAMLIRWAIKPG